MEEKLGGNRVWRLAAASTEGRLARRTESSATPVAEDASPQVARENIIKDMMRIFDALLGCTPKRTGVSLAFMHARRNRPEEGSQRRLEQEIYRLIKGLVELNSPNTGFALDLLCNNGLYYYNKAAVPRSFGIFLASLVEFLEGHDCLGIGADEMARLKSLASRA